MVTSDASFQTRLTHVAFPKATCELPFAVGGATQTKPQSESDSRNSQDALSIAVERRVISAVVTDGCTGTHPALEEASYSSNEVGAKLLAWHVARQAALMATVLDADPAAFLAELTKHTLKAIGKIASLATGKAKAPFLLDYLMATIVGVIITSNRYLVYHCGDGIAVVNGEVIGLDDYAGVYIANELVLPKKKRGKVWLRGLSEGATGSLRSVFVATDGLSAVWEHHPEAMRAFVLAAPNPNRVRNGVDFLLPEFRQRVAWNAEITMDLHDDATFALVRRVHAVGGEDASA